MYAFKFYNTVYIAYKNNEVGNPHPKKYACLASVKPVLDGYGSQEIRIVPNQRRLILDYMNLNKLDYHEVISYKEKDINTYDLVTALIKFHEMKRV